MGHIQRHHLSDALLAVPGHELLDAMSAVLEPVFESTWRRHLESRALAAQRDALLPKLVSGDIRIPGVQQQVRI